MPARVELGPGLALSGRVVNAVGEPVAARLRGHSFIRDLPGGGAWELELVAGNVGSTRLEVAGIGGETIDLGVVRAPPSAAIFGHVVGEGREALFLAVPDGQTIRCDDRSVRVAGRVTMGGAPTGLVRVACNANGRWVLGGWRNLREALKGGLTFDPGESTAALALIGGGPAAGIAITRPGGWNLGELRMWFGGGPTFAAGETVTNLPAGAWTIAWGSGSRSAFTERRRVTEVDLDD